MSTGFATAVTEVLNSLLTEEGFPAPVLQTQGGRWDTASLCAALNALTEIKRSSPERFRAIARSPGPAPYTHLTPPHKQRVYPCGAFTANEHS